MSMNMAIWIFGLLATGILGGFLGNHHGYDGAAWGTLWGLCAFAAVKMWITLELARR